MTYAGHGRGMRSSWVWPLGLTVALHLASPARADETAHAPAPTTLDADQATRLMTLIDGDRRLASVFAMCPADAFRRDAPVYALYVKPESDEAACATDPVACYRRCAEDAQGSSCFGLARLFQENPDTVANRYAQTLFAMACDAGMGAGCTNRAASLRNNPVDGEPLMAATEVERANCEHRSFDIACRQGDAWGCAMLGQTYQYGEGIERDATRARRYYDQSCAISPSFAACDFAKRHMTSMPEPAR